MHALENFKGATVLVTHSEMILRRVATRLVVFDGGEVRLFEGGYQDFLEQVGWADERSRKPSPIPSGQKKRSRKELRRLRSEIISERSKSLKPLKARIEKMEQAIVSLEEEAKQGDIQMCDAASGGAGESIPALVKRSQVIKTEIQSLVEQLEPLTHQLSQLQEGFTQRLEKFQ
jgi:ATP-binding cassette subfamily F protein 3